MNNTFKVLTLCSSVALLLGTVQVAQAHSGFKTSTLSSADTTGTTWNAINVTHGCGDSKGASKDVIALSILFPVAATKDDFAANVIASKGTADVIITNYDPTTDFDFGATRTTPSIAYLAPQITALTAGNIFPNTIPIAVNGRTVGFQSWLGKPYTGGSPIIETTKDDKGNTINTTGSGIFSIGKIAFRPTSCVKTLKIYAASVNWCESGSASFKSTTRLDAWVQAADTIFSRGSATSEIQEPPSPPTLTIIRDVSKTPITSTDCSGQADTIILQPKNEFINKYVPIKAKSTSFWPTGDKTIAPQL
jgi:hypothetical protein